VKNSSDNLIGKKLRHILCLIHLTKQDTCHTSGQALYGGTQLSLFDVFFIEGYLTNVLSLHSLLPSDAM
jgi:hypothetical protein